MLLWVQCAFWVEPHQERICGQLKRWAAGTAGYSTLTLLVQSWPLCVQFCVRILPRDWSLKDRWIDSERKLFVCFGYNIHISGLNHAASSFVNSTWLDRVIYLQKRIAPDCAEKLVCFSQWKILNDSSGTKKKTFKKAVHIKNIKTFKQHARKDTNLWILKAPRLCAEILKVFLALKKNFQGPGGGYFRTRYELWGGASVVPGTKDLSTGGGWIGN